MRGVNPASGSRPRSPLFQHERARRHKRDRLTPGGFFTVNPPPLEIMSTKTLAEMAVKTVGH